MLFTHLLRVAHDRAFHLKPSDSELCRFSGDAYYYRGEWAAALEKYQRAVQIEPIEEYFLDLKIEFSRSRIRRGKRKDHAFMVRRKASHCISWLGVKLAEVGLRLLAQPLFILAKRLCELDFNTNRWLALYANRTGQYEGAIMHLKDALSTITEDVWTRLNLTVDMIFRDKGKFTEESRKQARIALFHGGPEMRHGFRLRLTNTEACEDLCTEFEGELVGQVRSEREKWQQRREKVLRSEEFGEVIHLEFRR